jgi:hypothetical protein
LLLTTVEFMTMVAIISHVDVGKSHDLGGRRAGGGSRRRYDYSTYEYCL